MCALRHMYIYKHNGTIGGTIGANGITDGAIGRTRVLVSLLLRGLNSKVGKLYQCLLNL